MTKPIPRVYSARFFQLVTTRRFAEAERILERIKQKMRVSERNHGYFQALYGILLTQKNNDDRYAFLASIDLANKKQLKHCRQEFLSHAENRLHAEYDRGFFEAWADYMRILPKLESSLLPANSKGVTETEKDSEALAKVKAGQETISQVGSEEKGETEMGNQSKSAKENTRVELAKSGQITLSDFTK